MKPSEYHACASGDCPHQTSAECVTALLALADEQYEEIERLKEEAKASVSPSSLTPET